MAVMAMDPPIPAKVEGFPMSTGSSGTEIEIFWDLHCADSKSTYPDFLKFYNSNINGMKAHELYTFKYYFDNLPFHQNSFVATLGLTYLVENNMTDKVVPYMEWNYAHQDEFLGAPALKLSVLDVKQKLATEAGPAIGLTAEEFMVAFNDQATNSVQRVNWKFIQYNAITGTPVARVNGVQLATFPETYAEWQKIFGGEQIDEEFLA
jgi:hypothetical protein